MVVAYQGQDTLKEGNTPNLILCLDGENRREENKNEGEEEKRKYFALMLYG